MPYRRPRPWGNTKPPVGTRVNWNNPLSRGLIAAWTFANNGGKIVTNSTDKSYNATLPSSGYFLGRPTLFGKGLDCAATTQVVTLNKALSLDATKQLTIAFRILVRTPTAFGSVLVAGAATGVYIIASGADYRVGLYPNIQNSTLLATNKWYSVVISILDASISNYINGVFDGRDASPASVTYAMDGIGSDSAGDNLDGILDYLYVWDRGMPGGSNEVMQLHTQPFSMFQPYGRRIISLAAAGAPSFAFNGRTGVLAALAAQHASTKSFSGSTGNLSASSDAKFVAKSIAALTGVSAAVTGKHVAASAIAELNGVLASIALSAAMQGAFSFSGLAGNISALSGRKAVSAAMGDLTGVLAAIAGAASAPGVGAAGFAGKTGALMSMAGASARLSAIAEFIGSRMSMADATARTDGFAGLTGVRGAALLEIPPDEVEVLITSIFEVDLKGHLQSDAGIAALVADRITPLIRKLGTGLPAIIYERMAGSPVNSLDGFTSALWNISEQITVWSSSHTQVLALAKLVRERMDVPADSFRALMNLDADSYDVETKLYSVTMDFSCFFMESHITIQ